MVGTVSNVFKIFFKNIWCIFLFLNAVLQTTCTCTSSSPFLSLRQPTHSNFRERANKAGSCCHHCWHHCFESNLTTSYGGTLCFSSSAFFPLFFLNFGVDGIVCIHKTPERWCAWKNMTLRIRKPQGKVLCLVFQMLSAWLFVAGRLYIFGALTLLFRLQVAAFWIFQPFYFGFPQLSFSFFVMITTGKKSFFFSIESRHRAASIRLTLLLYCFNILAKINHNNPISSVEWWIRIVDFAGRLTFRN